MQLPVINLVQSPADTKESSPKKQTRKLNQEMLTKIKNTNKHQKKNHAYEKHL